MAKKVDENKYAHPAFVPRMCKIFGHRRWNDVHVGYVAGNPCTRRGCPGDGHLWRLNSTVMELQCQVSGCPVSKPFQTPTGPGR